MARGTQDVAPLEMTKWFDTNYHYLVPELGPGTVFTADSTKQVSELKEALTLGLTARPVLVGPITYLLLAKPAPGVAADFEPLTLLDRLLPVYAEVLADLRAAGAEWVQLDEPALVQDRTPAELNAAMRAYRDLGGSPTGRKSWSRPTSTGSARRCTSSPRRRWRGSRSTSPRPRPPTWTTWPRRAVSPASGSSPVSSTAVTSGSTTSPSPSPHWARCSVSPSGSTWPPRARCSMCRSTPRPSGTSSRRSCAGWRSHGRRRPRSSPSPRAWRRAPTRSPPNSPPTGPTWPPAQVRPSPATPPYGHGPPPSPMRTRAAPGRTTSGRRPSGRISGCRRCRRPPSGRSRRQPNSAPRGPT